MFFDPFTVLRSVQSEWEEGDLRCWSSSRYRYWDKGRAGWNQQGVSDNLTTWTWSLIQYVVSVSSPTGFCLTCFIFTYSQSGNTVTMTKNAPPLNTSFLPPVCKHCMITLSHIKYDDETLLSLKPGWVQQPFVFVLDTYKVFSVSQ